MLKTKILFSSIAALLFAVMLGGTATNAWAEDLPASKLLSSLTVNHTMYANAAADLDGIVYTVNFEPYNTLNEPGAHNVPAAVTTAMESLPVTFSPASASPSSGSTEWTKEFATTKTLEQVFGSASNFGSAGVYGFTASESAAGGTSHAQTNSTDT